LLEAAGLSDRMAGVFDGDTPDTLRRKLRDKAAVIFSNPDMVHAAIMPHHGRWANFLSGLRFLVIDELHAYNGMFGSNAANLFRRFFRLCRHYGADPQIVSCSATIGNPRELGERLLSREMGLPTWDKPATPCLASRIPYGQVITSQKLSRIEHAESLLRNHGFAECRVRDHETVARIELPPVSLARAVELRETLVDHFKALGFSYVTLDLQGFRSGSMNEVLNTEERY